MDSQAEVPCAESMAPLVRAVLPALVVSQDFGLAILYWWGLQAVGPPPATPRSTVFSAPRHHSIMYDTEGTPFAEGRDFGPQKVSW